MDTVIDYGLIHRARDNDDGSKSVYMRVAAADRPMLYLNTDGTTRKESISREQLFDKASIETMKLQVLTLDHPSVDVTPDNYHQYSVGSTSNIIVADGDYMGVPGVIRSRRALDAYNRGIRQISPGYNRELVRDSNGDLRQMNRRYNHNAIVEFARGGDDIKIKDSLDGSDSSYTSSNGVVMFDPTQINDDLVQLWSMTTDAQDLMIARLLECGELSPRAIDLSQFLNKPMTATNITIGGKSLLVDSASADDASKIASDYNTLKDRADKADKLLAQLTDAEATSVKLKAELDRKVADEANLDAKISEALTALSSARKESSDLKTKGVVTDAAEKMLDNNNLVGYKSAIVKSISKSFDPVNDASEVDIRYKQVLDSFSSGMFPDVMLENLNSTMSKASGTLETAKRGISNGVMRGLPSDSDWE